MESTRKWITLDLAVGEQVVVGDAIATVLEIDGDQATIIVEHLDYEQTDQFEDAELTTT